MDECLSGLFGPHKGRFVQMQQEYDAEQRELIERHRIVTQELIAAALDRLTFFGGERLNFLGEAMNNTRAQREALDAELREALVEARTRYDRKVNALLGEAEDC
jgi:hypothetical protein